MGVSTFNFNSDLRSGISGDDVRQLQTQLKAQGLFNGPITGTFGPLTLQAVKAFQLANKLPQTGFVGPLTRAALNNSASTSNVPSVTPSGSNLTNMTLKQFVQMLIDTGAISQDKMDAAKKFVQ